MRTARHAAVFLAGALSAPAAAAPLSIDAVASPETLAVLRVDDYPAMREALARTPMWKLSENPAVAEWLESFRETDEAKNFTEMLDKLEIELEDVPEPAGHAGLALWSSDPEAAEPHFIAVIDFADAAEDAEDLLIDYLATLEEEGFSELVFEDAGDYEIITQAVIFDEDAEREERLRSVREQRAQSPEPDAPYWDQIETEIENAEMAPPAPDVSFTRAGSWLILTTDRERLGDALDVFEGERIDALAETAALERARAETDGAHLDVVFFPEALKQLFSEVPGAMFFPAEALAALGLDQINAATLSLRLDTADAQAELSGLVGLEDAGGLFSLFTELDGFTPPPFSSDADGEIASFAFDFPSLIPVVRDAILALPQQDRAQLEGTFTAFSVAAGPVLQSLGPDIHFITRYRLPYSPESAGGVVAVRAANEPVIAGAITQYGGQFGVQARDFLGHQIWEAPPMMGASLGVGLGAGWAFFGAPEEIENAFRALDAAADQPRDGLAAAPGFQAGAARLAPGAFAYSYRRASEWLPYAHWNANHAEEVVRALIANMGFEPEQQFIDYMIDEHESMITNRLLLDAPEPEVFLQGLGDDVSEARMTDRGVRLRWLLLRPIED